MKNNLPLSLLYCLVLFYSDSSYSGTCEDQFGYVQRRLLDVSPSGIRKFFSNPENIENYSGPRGFLRFTKDYFGGYRFRAFNTVIFKALETQQRSDLEIKRELGWIKFEDSIALYSREELKVFFSKPGNIFKYKTQDGYLDFAAEFFNGNMRTAFSKVSRAVDLETFNKLNWQLYTGSVYDFFQKENRNELPSSHILSIIK